MFQCYVNSYPIVRVVGMAAEMVNMSHEEPWTVPVQQIFVTAVMEGEVTPILDVMNVPPKCRVLSGWQQLTALVSFIQDKKKVEFRGQWFNFSDFREQCPVEARTFLSQPVAIVGVTSNEGIVAHRRAMTEMFRGSHEIKTIS